MSADAWAPKLENQQCFQPDGKLLVKITSVLDSNPKLVPIQSEQDRVDTELGYFVGPQYHFAVFRHLGGAYALSPVCSNLLLDVRPVF